jgi:hypothetical protein
MKNDIQPGLENGALQKRRMFALAGFGAAFAINCILFMFAFGWFEPDRLSLSDRYFPSPTATVTSTITPTPTLTPTRTLRPTQTSTPTATITPTPHVLITPPGGETVFEERFDSNEQDWYAYFTNNTVLVETGKLTLRSEESDKIGIAYCTDCPSLADPFYFQAEVSTAENTLDPYGLAFCSPGFGSDFYVFQINPRTHLYDLYKHSAQGWKALTVTNSSPAINAAPNSNILGVQFDHGEINLFINNLPMKSYQDDDPFKCRRSGFIVNGGGFDLVVDNVFAYAAGATPAPSP